MKEREAFDGRLPFVLNTIGESPRQNPIEREEGPTWNQFIWVKAGTGIFRIGSDTFTLEPGQGVFMRNGIPHAYEGENLHTCWCTFFSSENLIDYVIGQRSYLLFDVPDFLEKETRALSSYARGNSSMLALSAAGYTYVTELFAAITGSDDTVIGQVREYLEKNYMNPVTLDDVAESVGLDRFALCRYFSAHHSCSVMEELKRIRISRAKRLLRYSSDSVESIGRLCGFESPSYFSMRFREECGCTPVEYRKKHL